MGCVWLSDGSRFPMAYKSGFVRFCSDSLPDMDFRILDIMGVFSTKMYRSRNSNHCPASHNLLFPDCRKSTLQRYMEPMIAPGNKINKKDTGKAAPEGRALCR